VCARHLPVYATASEHLNRAIRKWDTSRRLGEPDFSPIFDCEKTLRNAELQNVWGTTARYGNGENKRVKSERVGVVGRSIATSKPAAASCVPTSSACIRCLKPALIKKAHRDSVWAYDGGQEYGLVMVAQGQTCQSLTLST